MSDETRLATLGIKNPDRVGLSLKLLHRTVAFAVEGLNCERYGCDDTAVVGVKAGGARLRPLCRTHALALVSDMTSAEERVHVDGLVDFLNRIMELVS